MFIAFITFVMGMLPVPLTQKIDSLLKEKRFEGSVLLAVQNHIVLCKGYGLANREHSIANTCDTVFRLGSLTKQFTAVCILQLQEKGLLSVEDPITNYLPNYPCGERITIHHLLTHTSGIPSITKLDRIAEIQRFKSNPERAIAYFKDLPLNFEPGTSCDYSDSGYIILGAIIEMVSKMSYEDYIRKNIFEPLAMKSSYYDHNPAIIPLRASGYALKPNGDIVNASFIDMSFPHAAGALASTVKDLYLWDRALRTEKILSKKSLESLFTIQAQNAENRIAYGYGFRIGPRNRDFPDFGTTVIGHFGSIDGFRAAYIFYPDVDVTIILLSNMETMNVRGFQKELASLIFSNLWRWRA